MGRAPESIAILGSGAMPETGVWVTGWAQEHGKKVRIHSLEIIPERLEMSKKVYDALCGSDDCTFETGDIKDAPNDLREHDAVYFNAAVGVTTMEKENILLDIVSRMRPGAFVLTRSTHSIKTMAYPVSDDFAIIIKNMRKQPLTLNKACQDPNTAYSQKAETDSHMPIEWRSWEERERKFHHFQGHIVFVTTLHHEP
jgi:Nicotianamine synthase protein